MVAVLHDYHHIFCPVSDVPGASDQRKDLDPVLFANCVFCHLFAVVHDGWGHPAGAGGVLVLLWHLSVVATETKWLEV